MTDPPIEEPVESQPPEEPAAALPPRSPPGNDASQDPTVEPVETTDLASIRSPNRLLVPVASAAAARDKLDDVLSFAHAAESTIIALFVMTKPTPELRAKGERACAVFAPACEAAGVTLRCCILDGDVVDVILRVAIQERVDAIILGATETGLLSRLIKGNIPKRVVHQTDLPVMILARDPTGDDAEKRHWLVRK